MAFWDPLGGGGGIAIAIAKFKMMAKQTFLGVMVAESQLYKEVIIIEFSQVWLTIYF